MPETTHIRVYEADLERIEALKRRAENDPDVISKALDAAEEQCDTTESN